ncbi:MAG TPA: endonuclease/exonuclease/phosphatase family protein, partial [Trueperaceae bacterium]
LAGDFNVAASTPELDVMLGTLAASWPPVVGTVRTTWDPDNNEWADGPAAWLDYVLIAHGYAAPSAAWNRALPLREGGRDLSDHYAVWARVALAPDP